MAFSPFTSYGNFKIQTFNDVVFVTLYGSSDRKILQELSSDLNNISINFLKLKWFLIFDLRYWDFAPPEVVNLISEKSEKLQTENPPQKLLFIVKNKIKKAFIKKQYSFHNNKEMIYIENPQKAFEILKKINNGVHLEKNTGVSQFDLSEGCADLSPYQRFIYQNRLAHNLI